MQEPGVYVLEAMNASVHDRASQPVAAQTDRFLSGERLRWAECTRVAPPCKRNRGEMLQAFDEFKERFHNSPEQLSQDQRCHKKRARLNVYLKQVFGHHRHANVGRTFGQNYFDWRISVVACEAWYSRDLMRSSELLM
jgi:hypothetical protein